MGYKIDIATLFNKAFGLNVKVSSYELPNDIIGFGDIEVIEGEDQMVNGLPINKYTFMGTPVYDYIRINPGNYYDFDGNLISYDAYDFPYACIVELSQPSMIEETYLTGRKGGTVKEFLGEDDWYITIRGLIINYENTNYPTEQVAAFREMIKHTTELSVESPFFSLFDIDEIVIMDRNIAQVEGALHYQPFTLLCKSNEPFILSV